MAVVRFLSPEGEIVNYRPLSDRLPEFLEAYPPAKGYRVEIEFLDPIEVKPGLRRLYEAAISAGKSPDEMELPPIVSGTMIFRATLLDPEGRVIQTASALRPIQSYKDWEKGETAARQRLLAVLGFGGEVLDDDEEGDMRDQGITTLDSDVSATPGSTPKASAKPKPKAKAKAEARTGTGTAGAASDDGDAIPVSMLRQIEHQANLKGVPVPEVHTVIEAKAALKKLLQG